MNLTRLSLFRTVKSHRPVRIAIIAGALFFTTIYSMAAILGSINERTGSDLEARFSDKLYCNDQKAHLNNTINKTNGEVVVGKTRVQRLKKLLLAEEPSLLIEARRALSEEQAILAKLVKKLRLQHIQPVRVTAPVSLLMHSVIALVCFWSQCLIERQMALAFRGRIARIMIHWKKAFLLLSCLMVSTMWARMALTSVVIQKKSWFTFDSYCISENAFLIGRIASIGGALVVAAPGAVLWLLSSPSFRPLGKSARMASRLALDPLAPDGQCGVGAYLRIQEGWFLASGVTVLILSSIWLSFAVLSQNRFEPRYLFTYTIGIAMAAIVMYRFLSNIFWIRTEYYHEISRNFKKWEEVKEIVAPDPTEPFLGKSTWSLATRLAGFLGLTWAFLRWSGIGGALTGMFGN